MKQANKKCGGYGFLIAASLLAADLSSQTAAEVYSLDLAVSPPRWEKISPAAGNTVIPTPRTKWGTYGRWRYIPSKGVFIGVNETDEKVYFYKMDSGLNISTPSIPVGGES